MTRPSARQQEMLCVSNWRMSMKMNALTVPFKCGGYNFKQNISKQLVLTTVSYEKMYIKKKVVPQWIIQCIMLIFMLILIMTRPSARQQEMLCVSNWRMSMKMNALTVPFKCGGYNFKQNISKQLVLTTVSYEKMYIKKKVVPQWIIQCIMLTC